MAWVARSIKQLIVDGAAEPQDIAVVARTGGDDTRLAIRALRHAGVPASGRIRSSLTEVAAIKALLLVFRGATRQWDYQSLRAVLDNPYFDTKVDLRGIDFIAGAYRPAGLNAWHEKLETALRLVQQNDRETWNKGLFEDQLEKDVRAFDRVRETLRCLNDPRPEAAWIDLTLGFLKENRGLFLLRRRLCDPVGDRWDIVRLDQRGVLQLEQLLHEWRELDLDDRPIDSVAWYAMLRRMLEGSELVLATPGQKGVQVLEAHDAGLVPFSHTFVVHANDGEFPLAGNSTGVLSDEERERLNDLGIPLDHRETALRRERSLWRAVTGQAGQVHVSYRSTDPTGKPLLPSLMIGGPNHELLDELPRLYRPTGEKTVTPEDGDQQAAFLLANRLVSANSGEPSRIQIAPSHPDFLQQAIIAAVAESHRGPGLARIVDSTGHPALRPNPWNGELRDSDVISFLEDKFDDEYTWSAGQLQTYARVPFQFFLTRVLRLTTREEAEDETSRLTFGSVAHEILERFYGEHLNALPAALVGACADQLDVIAEAVFQEREASSDWLGLPNLWSMTRESIWDAVRGYVSWELEYLQDKNETPVLVEHRFGFDGDPVLLSGSDVIGRSSSLRLRGKIDRVDRTGTSDNPVLHVLDYKSKSTPSTYDYEDGTAQQGVLYLEVLALDGHEVKFGRYRAIEKPGKPQNGGLIKYGSDQYVKALSISLSIPARAREGLFEPIASRKGGWADWDVPLEIRRTEAQVEHGNRFEPPANQGGL
jgi:ATP-dependent helicase/nuclease subunit B